MTAELRDVLFWASALIALVWLFRLRPCLFGHEERVREWDAARQCWLVCPRCRDRVAVLRGHPRATGLAPPTARRAARDPAVVLSLARKRRGGRSIGQR